MQFEYYVLNYDTNKKKVINYNIFNNINVQECTEKEVRKYLRAPKKYKHIVQYKKSHVSLHDSFFRDYSHFPNFSLLPKNRHKKREQCNTTL